MNEELKKRLIDVYSNIKSTDDFYKLENCLFDIHQYILQNCNEKEIIEELQKLNEINRSNVNTIVNTMCQGNTKYFLKEVSNTNLYKVYELPREGSKFKWEVLDSYELVDDFRKLKSIYNIKYDEGIALFLNGKYTFRFIKESDYNGYR